MTELRIGATCRAKDLPPGAVARTTTATEYVKCARIDSLMRWEQPIPGSGEWLVVYVGRLREGEWMTEREHREVAACRKIA